MAGGEGRDRIPAALRGLWRPDEASVEKAEHPLDFRGAATRRGLLGYGAIFSLAAGVGVLSGIGALVFRWAEQVIHHFAVGPAESLVEAVGHFPWYQRLFLPAAGILVAAFLVRRFLGRRGPSIDVMEAVVLQRGPMRLRDELLRVLASLLCIGTGGSVGPEGPVVELGAAVGSKTASLTRERKRTVSLLASCGAAGGLAAAFNAPIGAAIFVLEIMIGRLSVDRFAPVVVASVAAVFVSQAAYGDRPVFQVEALRLRHHWELAPVLLLGVLGGFLGAVFLRTLDWVRAEFLRLQWPFWARALAGGASVGALGFFFPQVMGSGFDSINLMLAAKLSVFTLAFLVPLKILATSATLGGGGLGGVFAPTLFTGAALGGLLGAFLHHATGGASSDPGAYALMGMAALVGATLHAPVTAVLLLFELSRDYTLVPPLMLVTIVATVIARRLHPWSLYTQKLRRQGVRITGREGDLLLVSTTAGSTMDPVRERVDRRASVAEVVRRLEGEHQGEVYVVDGEGRLEGWIRSEDMAGVAVESLEGVAVAEDLVRQPAWVVPEASLAEALELMDRTGQDELPVVEGGAGGRLAGVLTRRAITRRMRSGD